MALRAEYSLVHSEFNDFLFAFVGEEKNGIQLTVLSALARLGVDPWGEAARLSELTSEAATSALAAWRRQLLLSLQGTGRRRIRGQSPLPRY